MGFSSIWPSNISVAVVLQGILICAGSNGSDFVAQQDIN